MSDERSESRANLVGRVLKFNGKQVRIACYEFDPKISGRVIGRHNSIFHLVELSRKPPYFHWQQVDCAVIEKLVAKEDAAIAAVAKKKEAAKIVENEPEILDPIAKLQGEK
jgi:oligoribonuclease (3'-5' exoribonuclease)|tara:strand:+ start:845 stop:1177 length:333 start_codon:yes stop_codon:yes gene_type:complete